jgi:hypothetical protein
VRLARRTNCAAPGKIRARTISCSLVRIDRKSLPLGTARLEAAHRQHSVAPTPAAAVACLQPPSPSPINTNTVGPDQAIICVNTEPRTNPAGNVINLTTNGTGSYTKPAVPSPSRTSDILARDTSLFFGRAYGIYAYANRPISVDNTDDITAIGNDEIVRGISVETRFGDSPVSIVNCGDIAASGGGDNFGIFATARVNSHQHREQRGYCEHHVCGSSLR